MLPLGMLLVEELRKVVFRGRFGQWKGKEGIEVVIFLCGREGRSLSNAAGVSFLQSSSHGQ